jgi:hypothetical protein
VTLLGPVYETGRETQVPLFKALEQAMTAIVENQQTHLPEFYQQRIAGMNHQLFRPGYSNEEEWGSIKSLGSKAEDYDTERIAGILESSEYRKPGLEMAIRMQPTIDQNPATVTLEGYRFVLQPSGKGQAEWFTQVVKLKGRKAGKAFRNALIGELTKPFEKTQKTFVLNDTDVSVWQDKNTAGVLTFDSKEFTADAEPILKEVVEVCVKTRLCPEVKVEGNEFALVSDINDAKQICSIFDRELINKETLLRLSLTEEGSNLLEEENGNAWHSGGESGFFEENYNHLDFITAANNKGITSGVVWCRSPVKETFNFQERPEYFVIDRGWRTLKIYRFSNTGIHLVSWEEVVVEFTGYDDFYPINHGTILETSFSDDRIPQFQRSFRSPSQPPILVKRILNAQLILESYPIDVIASGYGWEKKFSNIPVYRLGTEFTIYNAPSFSSFGFDLGFQLPVISNADVITDKGETTLSSVNGRYLKFTFGGDYIKFLPNTLWNFKVGTEIFKINGIQIGNDYKSTSYFFETNLIFRYQNVVFSLGQIFYSGGYARLGGQDIIERVDIPKGSSILIGIGLSGVEAILDLKDN